MDRLCIIIQNDDRDREIECNLMEHVFASAYCTIAATSTGGCEGGFLRVDESMPHDGHVADFSEDVSQAELNQRGWVFQERALSIRTIHFAARRTYWECEDRVCCANADKIAKIDV
jgi:hypothetical protein